MNDKDKNIVKDAEWTYKYNRYKTTWGIILFIFLVCIHIFYDEIPYWFMAMPFFLVGLDPTKFNFRQ